MQENVVAFFVLFIFIAAIVASTGYGPRARLVPIPIAAIGALIMIAQIALQNLRSEQDLKVDLLEFISRKATGDHEEETAGEGGSAEPARRRTAAREFGALGLLVLIVGMFLVIGPIPAMFLFTAGYFVLSRHYSVPLGLLYALAGTAAVYVLFDLWLGVDMNAGIYDLGFGLF
nr:tripartite tricarboxylate transporter TctB family protein [Propylenella binzhouense]